MQKGNYVPSSSDFFNFHIEAWHCKFLGNRYSQDEFMHPRRTSLSLRLVSTGSRIRCQNKGK